MKPFFEQIVCIDEPKMEEGDFMKQVWLGIGLVTQIIGFIFLFFEFIIGITFIGLSFISFVIILIYLIKERIQEKKEEEENDYRNY